MSALHFFFLSNKFNLSTKPEFCRLFRTITFQWWKRVSFFKILWVFLCGSTIVTMFFSLSKAELWYRFNSVWSLENETFQTVEINWGIKQNQGELLFTTHTLSPFSFCVAADTIVNESIYCCVYRSFSFLVLSLTIIISIGKTFSIDKISIWAWKKLQRSSLLDCTWLPHHRWSVVAQLQLQLPLVQPTQFDGSG